MSKKKNLKVKPTEKKLIFHFKALCFKSEKNKYIYQPNLQKWFEKMHFFLFYKYTTFRTKKMQKNAKKYECEKCNFVCISKSNYTKHTLTAKHQNRTNRTEKMQKSPPQHMCRICNKYFGARNSLWYHKQKCIVISYDDATKVETNNITTDSIMLLMSQNQDFKQMFAEQNQIMIDQQNENKKLQAQLVEAASDTKTITNITNNTQNNNQKFNLNLFLNTTCKDAMNMSDFIENLQVNFKDIENIGKNGYISGMTNMILSRIKDLDITKRPLHCTDLKRETMYIKDNDEWSKDSSDNAKLRDMISIVAKQNYNTVPIWRKEHPDCNVSDHPSYNLCMDMMKNIIGDVGLYKARLDSKVIKNISRHIIVK